MNKMITALFLALTGLTGCMHFGATSGRETVQTLTYDDGVRPKVVQELKQKSDSGYVAEIGEPTPFSLPNQGAGGMMNPYGLAMGQPGGIYATGRMGPYGMVGNCHLNPGACQPQVTHTRIQNGKVATRSAPSGKGDDRVAKLETEVTVIKKDVGDVKDNVNLLGCDAMMRRLDEIKDPEKRAKVSARCEALAKGEGK
jgi:hypothetical protein